MKLQFITHQTDTYSYYDSAELALRGGCRWIQLRMKEASIDGLEKEAIKIQALCRAYEATFIIDDHVELAYKLKADGVHLGKNDMPIIEARKLLGKDFIIGGTANTYHDIELHYQHGADYIGLGPFRFTATKKNLSPILGIEGYTEIMNRMRTAGIELPVVAIGGITVADIPNIMRAGVTGIALSGAILNAEDPILETRQVLDSVRSNTRFVQQVTRNSHLN